VRLTDINIECATKRPQTEKLSGTAGIRTFAADFVRLHEARSSG
jgi:hypothetical protein